MRNFTFQNPVLSGFYPDPSICRVGEDYYMVTSSFVYFPGLPVFHSKDLVHWEQISHGIAEPDALDYRNCETSLGLWAPTIRYDRGMFYIINTFVSGGREVNRDNFIITAKDPGGPWSKPVFIEGADGIDPSIFFDRDERMWYMGNYIEKNPAYEGHHGIYLCELDKESFQFKGERKVIWNGSTTRSKWIEAPHIYFVNDRYYLLVAEGGTFTNHSVMMARSETIDGEYEICPRNPIVSHRHLSLNHEISVVGHGDLVETNAGEWWMVLLGVRPYRETHFNTGRETFLVPIIWEEDGWPRVDNANGLVNTWEKAPNLEYFHAAPAFYSDNFEANKLGMQWNTIHPPKSCFYSLTEHFSHLRLYLQEDVMHEISTPAFIGRRQQHKCFRCKTAMEFSLKAQEEAGLALIQDDRFHYTFTVIDKNTQMYLEVREVRNSVITPLASARIVAGGRIYLSVCCDESGYHFYYGYTEQEMILLRKDADLSLLSSITNEGFTGAYIGMYATSNKKPSSSYADFDWFVYEGIR